MILSEKEKESLSTELDKIKTTNNDLNDRLRALMNDKKELEGIVASEVESIRRAYTLFKICFEK